MGQSPAKRSKDRALSAHQAGRVAPHTTRRAVRYDPDEGDQTAPSLTVREEEVLSLLSENKSNFEISTLAGIAVATVEKHIEHIYPKLGVNSRAEAAIWFLMRKMQRENAAL